MNEVAAVCGMQKKSRPAQRTYCTVKPEGRKSAGSVRFIAGGIARRTHYLSVFSLKNICPPPVFLILFEYYLKKYFVSAILYS